MLTRESALGDRQALVVCNAAMVHKTFRTGDDKTKSFERGICFAT